MTAMPNPAFERTRRQAASSSERRWWWAAQLGRWASRQLAGGSEYMTRKILAFFLICLSVALVAVSFPTQAQPASKIARVGWLAAPAAAGHADFVKGFRDGLRQLGYNEGKNIVIEFRFADGQMDRLPSLALELANLRVDAIVVVGSQAAVAARGATATIPIVMVSVGDPAAIGLVASLAKPGGNVTGLSTAHSDLATKWLELLLEVVPKASLFGYLDDPNSPVSPNFLRNIQAVGRTRGVSVQFFPVTKPDDVESQLTAMSRAGVQGFIVAPNPVPRTRQRAILDFASKNRLPAMYAGRDYVDAGGLMSYDPSRPGMGRQGAVYVDKVLKGAKPADLPVEQPTKIEFAINMKTARALGLNIPPSVLLRADHVVD
jgi:putative ABC transport system substrate-binding protein